MTDLGMLIHFLRKTMKQRTPKKSANLLLVVPLVLMRKNIGDAPNEIFFLSVHMQDSPKSYHAKCIILQGEISLHWE